MCTRVRSTCSYYILIITHAEVQPDPADVLVAFADLVVAGLAFRGGPGRDVRVVRDALPAAAQGN